jgi:hypothetical protein
MGNAAQVLKEHLSGLNDEQKINYLHTLFGNDAQKVANLLMQQGVAGLDNMQGQWQKPTVLLIRLRCCRAAMTPH